MTTLNAIWKTATEPFASVDWTLTITADPTPIGVILAAIVLLAMASIAYKRFRAR